MRVKSLELSNFKTIKEYKSDFEGNIYFVIGENEIGKSTLLQSIAILLTGSREDVLSNGAEKGFAKAIIGGDGKEYKVELKFTKKNPKGVLSITDTVSGMSSSNISAFQDIFGYSDFDANDFVSWSETAEGRRKQIDIIKSMLSKEVQAKVKFADGENAKTFESRKVANSEVKVFENLLKAKEKAIKGIDIVKYQEPKDSKQAIQAKVDAVEFNEQYEGVEERVQERDERIALIPGEKEELEKIEKDDKKYFEEQRKQAEAEFKAKIAQIAKEEEQNEAKHAEIKNNLENELKTLSEKQEKAKKWLKENEKEDLEQLQKEIDTLEEHNEKHKTVKEYLEAEKNYKAAKAKSEKLTKQLEKGREEREKLIKSQKLPIDGLSFSEDGLTLNGVPFQHDKISTSQEMEVAVKVLMTMNPKTKVFRIARGESLGSKKLKSIIDFADKYGYQGFIEEVRRGLDELVVAEYTEK